MWDKFTEVCVNGLELSKDGDGVTMIGDSVKSLANMLNADEIPLANPCACDRSDYCTHRLFCRHIIHNMFNTLMNSTKAGMDEWVICNMLATASAMIYLDRSTGDEFNENWDHFVDGDEVGKDECMHIKIWTQWKLAELGAPSVLVVQAGSENPSTKMAAIRFGTALLEVDLLSVCILCFCTGYPHLTHLTLSVHEKLSTYLSFYVCRLLSTFLFRSSLPVYLSGWQQSSARSVAESAQSRATHPSC